MSIGYNKELLIAMFASSLIKIIDHEDVVGDDTLLSLNNKDYHLNKRIDRRLFSLKKSIDDYIYDIVTPDIAKWLKKNTDKRVVKALNIANKHLVSLELLAVWILFSNFGEMNSRVDKSLGFLMDYDYMALAELLSKTHASQVDGEMFAISSDIISALKG